MDCAWNSSDDEASMQIDLDAKQDESTADNSTATDKPEGTSQEDISDTYDPSDPTDDNDAVEPLVDDKPRVEGKKNNICGGDDGDHDLDYDPADPTLSEDEIDTTKNDIDDDSMKMAGDAGLDKEVVEPEDDSAKREEVSSEETDNDGRWDSQLTSSMNVTQISSPEYDNSSTPEKEIGNSIRDDACENSVTQDGDEKDVSDVKGDSAAPLDRDENSQISTLSEPNNDNAIGDEGLSDDVPEVTFDDSDFILEKEPIAESAEWGDDRTTEKNSGDEEMNGERESNWKENDDESGRSNLKSSNTEGNKWEEEEDLDEKEREWRRRRQEEVAHLNEEALVDLFREESEPDKEIAEGEMAEQQTTKKTKKKLGSKKLKKKGKKLKGQGKKGQLSAKSQDPDHGDQRFVEISRERPSVESREEGELDGEGSHGLTRRRSYDDRGSQHRYNHRHDERAYHDDNDPREPGEIVESEGKKKGVKKKDKKEKKKKKSKREVATIEEGNQGDEDSQKFPSFLAGFFVQDGMEELEEGQEGFVNDFDEEDPRSLFAKASGDSNYRKRQDGSDKDESARSFDRAGEHKSDGHYAEEAEPWRNSRRHEDRWQENREVRHDSRERRHGSREGRYERDHRLDISNDRDKERERGRSRSERGRDRGRDREREREREREKEAERERERNRRSGEERRRGRGSRSRSRERRRRSLSRDRNRRSRSRDRSTRRRRHRSRSQDKSAERERDRERERERERSRRRRRERSRERESERRVRRVSHSKSRSPRRRSERASSNKENREESHRRRQRQRARSEEDESEERENGRRYRHQRRRERERSSSPTGSSSSSSSSQSPVHRPQLHHLNFQNYSEDEGNSSDVILVEPERIVINLDEEEDPPSRVDITHGNAGDDGNAMLEDGQRVPPPPEMAIASRSSALIQINPVADEDTRVVEALEESGDATPTRDEASDIVHGSRSSEAVKESDYDPAHPTEEDNEDGNVQEKEQITEQRSKSPVAAVAAAASATSSETVDTAPPTEKGPVPPDHPPPEEIRPSPPPIPAETEHAVPPPHQQLHPAQQQQQQQHLGPSPLAGGNLMNNPVLRLINPLLLQQQQKQMGLGAQPGGGLLPLPNTPPARMPFMMNQNRGDQEGGPPPGFPQDQQRHIRPLLQIPDRRPPGFGPGGPDSTSLLHHPFGPMGQQQPPNANNRPPNMHPRMPISAMPPLAQLTSLLPALEKAKMAQQQQQDGRIGPGPGSLFGKHHQPSLLGKPPPLSTSSASNNISLHNNMLFRPNRPDFSESTEVVDMDMSPGENDCELELPSPNSDSSREGRARKRSRGSGSRNLAAAAAGKGVVQPIAYLKALSKALEKLDPKGQSGSGQNSQDKGRSGGSSKKQRSSKVDLNDDDVPASAVDLTNKEKFMRKLHLQERVIDEVKLAIKPFYSSKRINKDQYKLILRKAVPKVCHCKGGNINPQKIQQLVEAYVKKMIKKHGGGPGGSGKKKSKGASKDGAHNAKDGSSGAVKQNGERSKKSVAGR